MDEALELRKEEEAFPFYFDFRTNGTDALQSLHFAMFGKSTISKKNVYDGSDNNVLQKSLVMIVRNILT